MFTFDWDWCIGFQHQKKRNKSTLQQRHLFQDQKQKKHYKGYSLKSHIYEILKENSFSHILCQEKDFTSKEFRKIGKGYFIWRFVKFVAESNLMVIYIYSTSTLFLGKLCKDFFHCSSWSAISEGKQSIKEWDYIHQFQEWQMFTMLLQWKVFSFEP